MDLLERVAKLEADYIHINEDLHELRSDIKGLVQFIKEHMQKEEEDRQVFLKELQEIKTAQAKMKSFWSGITFTVSMLWAAGAAAVYFFGKHSS